MADVTAYGCAELGTYSTSGPAVALSGSVVPGLLASQVFSGGVSDGQTVAVSVIKDAQNWATYTGATFTSGPDTIALSAAVLAESTGTISDSDTVKVIGLHIPSEGMIPGHIAGLQLIYSSGTELIISSGSAHIEATNAYLDAPSTITLSSLSLSADTWYHVYFYDNSGTPTAEVSTTAPATAYSGTARSKTGVATHRYLGSLKSLPGSAALVRFIHNLRTGALFWRAATNDTGMGRVLIVSGTTVLLSSAENDKLFSFAEAVPSTARMVYCKLINRSNQILYFADGDVTLDVSTASFIGVNKLFATDGINNEVYYQIPVNASQQAKYALATTATGSGPVVDCYGYFLER